MDWNDSLILAAGGKYVYLIVPPFLKNIIINFNDKWEIFQLGSDEYESGIRARIDCGENDI